MLADGIVELERPLVSQSHHQDRSECLRYRPDPVLGVCRRLVDAYEPGAALTFPPAKGAIAYEPDNTARQAADRLLVQEALL